MARGIGCKQRFQKRFAHVFLTAAMLAGLSPDLLAAPRVQAEGSQVAADLQWEGEKLDHSSGTFTEQLRLARASKLRTHRTAHAGTSSASNNDNVLADSAMPYGTTKGSDLDPVADNERVPPMVLALPSEEYKKMGRGQVQEAQFQLPQAPSEGQEPTQQLPSRLIYEYGYGSESEITYRADRDLNKHVDDDFLIATPQLNGYVTYRPTDWLDTTLELTLDREFPLQEEHTVILPNGDIEKSNNRRVSLCIDQAFATIKDVSDPYELTLGRVNFEDDRHYLYDTSLDVTQVSLKQGMFLASASVGRENLVDPPLCQDTEEDRNNTYIFYGEYRGIEDIKIAGYTIYRDDQRNEDGQLWHFGLRSHGFLSEELSYWVELGYVRGDDQMSENLSGYVFDVGGTYRIVNLPYNPNITLGFALATDDYRQTGLQSNETKFAGVSEFKIYGETVDPELSNLGIFTAGLGFRPSHDISLDFIFHKYWLYKTAEELQNSPITAQMNQDPMSTSKDVGSEFDIVLGFRELFGIRRLGVDLRMGLFFPGNAFRIENPDDSFSNADDAISVVAKFWW